MDLVLIEFEKAYKSKASRLRPGATEDDRPQWVHEDKLGRMMKRDLVKKLFGFYCKCLRLVRAYNFQERLIKMLSVYFEYFSRGKGEKFISQKKFLLMRSIFNVAYEKLKLKSTSDPNLVASEEF